MFPSLDGLSIVDEVLRARGAAAPAATGVHLPGARPEPPDLRPMGGQRGLEAAREQLRAQAEAYCGGDRLGLDTRAQRVDAWLRFQQAYSEAAAAQRAADRLVAEAKEAIAKLDVFIVKRQASIDALRHPEVVNLWPENADYARHLQDRVDLPQAAHDATDAARDGWKERLQTHERHASRARELMAALVEPVTQQAIGDPDFDPDLAPYPRGMLERQPDVPAA